MGLIGLPIAFLLNAASYLLASASLWRLRGLGRQTQAGRASLSAQQLSLDLRDGFVYLSRQRGLLYPLLLTLATVAISTPAVGLLAAIVHSRGGSIVDLGLLVTSAGLGAFAGAVYAGSRREGDNPMRRYGLYGIGAAAALVLFALAPASLITPLPLAAIGFILFSEAVWNTSRVPFLAQASFQGRIQSITTMTFTLGTAVGQLWGGVALDRFGVMSLTGGAAALGALSIAVLLLAKRTS
jgi:predicted MFS family arabinose efflux permease